MRVAREAKDRGRRLKDLSESNPTRCQLPLPVIPSAGGASGDALTYEPDPKGLPAARRAIADWYRTGGNEVSPEHIMLTASTSEGYSYLLSILCDSGDEILVPRPGYPLFDVLCRLSDVIVRQYDLRYDGEWYVDFDSLEAAVTKRTRAVVAIHPSNPTGSYLKEDEKKRLAEICVRRGLAMIVDEVFLPYSLDVPADSVHSIAGTQECLTFTLNGLSKLAGLPQHKLAWMAVSGPPGVVGEAIARLEVVADTYLSVGTPVQLALPSLLSNMTTVSEPLHKRIVENLNAGRDRLSTVPSVELLRCEGGWSAVLRLPSVKSDDEWALQFLQRRDVLVHPGHYFDFVGGCYVVLSLLPPTDIFREGIDDIANEVTTSVGRT